MNGFVVAGSNTVDDSSADATKATGDRVKRAYQTQQKLMPYGVHVSRMPNGPYMTVHCDLRSGERNIYLLSCVP